MSKEQSNFQLGENVSNTAKRPFAAVASSVRRASVLLQTGEAIGERLEARLYVVRTGVADRVKAKLVRRSEGTRRALADTIVVAGGILVCLARTEITDCIVTVAALRRGVSDALALRSPRRHRSPLGARERKTLL